MAEWHDTTEEYLEAILEIEEEGIDPDPGATGRAPRALGAGRLGDGEPPRRPRLRRAARRPHACASPTRAARWRRRSCAATGSPSGCSSTSSGSSGRRSTRRPTAGSTRSRPTSRRSSCCSSATPRRARTATRSRGRATRSTAPAAAPLTQSQPGPVIVRRISEKVEIDDERHRLPRRRRAHPRLERGRRRAPSTDGVQVESDAGEQTVPRKLAQLIYAIPA